MGDIDLGDIFGSFFGGGFSGFGGQQQRANAPQKGESLRANLSVTFEEAAFGCEKELELTRTEMCDACHGSGCEPAPPPRPALTAGGPRGSDSAGGGRLRLLHHRPMFQVPGDGQADPLPL